MSSGEAIIVGKPRAGLRLHAETYEGTNHDHTKMGAAGVCGLDPANSLRDRWHLPLVDDSHWTSQG